MKKSVVVIILTAFIAMTLPAAEPSEVTEQPTPPQEAPHGQPYVYKTSAGKERVMEIYFPPASVAGSGKVPGMILFHGGGWRNGSLASFRVAAAYFASRGIVCATAEYQMLDDAGRVGLAPGESFKRVCVIDAKSAIRWFHEKAGEFGVDPSRIIAGGGSAGAHISALATMNLTLADPADPVALDPKVAAYVWFNPAFSPDDHKDREIDILAHINDDLPPTVVFFGDQDRWKAGWDVAHAKWRSLGVERIELWIAPGQEHAFYNKGPWRPVTLRATDEFLVRHGLLTGAPTMPVPASGEALVLAR